MSSIGGGSLSAGTEENRLTQREEPRPTPSTIDPKKNMAEHSGKDILSSDVEIKGSIKFQKELLIDGKVEGEINSDGVLTIGENAVTRGGASKAATPPARPEIVRNEEPAAPAKSAFGARV